MYIKTSVRKLIEFVMRSGDIDNSFRDNNSCLLYTSQANIETNLGRKIIEGNVMEGDHVIIDLDKNNELEYQVKN